MFNRLKIRTRITGASFIASFLVAAALYAVTLVMVSGLATEAAKNDTWLNHLRFEERLQMEMLRTGKDAKSILTEDYIKQTAVTMNRSFQYFEKTRDGYVLQATDLDDPFTFSQQILTEAADTEEGMNFDNMPYQGTPYQLRVWRLKDNENPNSDAIGILVVALDLGVIDGILTDALFQMAGIGVLLLLAGLVLAWFTGRAISLPVTILRKVMERIKNNDTDFRVPAQHRGDEIGEMARTVEIFRQNVMEMADLKAAQEKSRVEAEESKRQAFAQLANTFEEEVQSVARDVAQKVTSMASESEVMSNTALETDQLLATVSEATETARANMERVAAAVIELSNTTSDIGEQVTHASTVSKSAVATADETNHTVSTLDEAARQIGEIVELINGIANQTNLLALNATIEAARAGEMGKGFAVVASEVKTLATQTTQATQDISDKVTGVQEIATTAVQKIAQIQKVIGDISSVSNQVADAVDKQNAATQEINTAVQDAARGTAEVSENIARVKAASSNTGQSAGQVEQASSRVSNMATDLNGKVQGFLTAIRSD